MQHRYLSTLICSLPLAANALAAEELRKSVDVVYTSNPPRIDGIVDDSEWAAAAIVDDLHQFEPEDHAPPSEQSKFFVTYDENFLYVAAVLYDANPNAIIARQLIQGQTLRFDDSISIVLDPFDTRRSGYNFQVNANGIRRESIFENTTEQNRDWETIWFTEGRITDQGWETEVAIPFKSISFDPAKADWGFSVSRTISHKREEVAWTSFARDVNPSTTGILRGIDRAEKGIGLDIVPSVTFTGRDGDISTNDNFEAEPSLDVFYKFTASLSGLLTFNTDFAATEVDDRQINLSRFSVSLPEKRDFFLQDADIFAFGGGLERNGVPFFSRRIGLGRGGTPLDIIAGAKITGRIAGFNIGVLDVLQESGVVGADDVNLLVGRVSYDVLEESTIGMIITDGDPLSELSNSVVGVDFLYRNKQLIEGTDLTVRSWYQRSDTEGIAGEDGAWGVGIDIPRQDGFAGSLDHLHIDQNFNPALGFVNRPGIDQTSAELNYVQRFTGKWIRRYVPGIEYRVVRDTTGNIQSEDFEFMPLNLDTDLGDRISFEISRERDVVNEAFEVVDGIEVAAGDYSFNRFDADYEGALERKLSFRVEVSWGDYYDGKLTSVETGLDWRPNRHIYIGLGYELNEGDMHNGKFTTKLITARANIAFNSKWSWINFIQYDNVSEKAGLNSRLRWNPKAGQDLYLVFNQGFERDLQNRFRSTLSELSAKVGYTFRF